MTVFFSRLLYTVFILPVSRLPFPVLYALSDGLFFVIYHLVRYRRKVVRGNLERSFPEKDFKEISRIENDFYRHFCDLTLESFKLFTISEAEIRKRMVFENTEVFDRLLSEGKSVIVAGGHYSNWEMFAVACQLYWKHQGIALYKPLANPWFEKVMKETRSQFGLQMVPIQQTKEFFEQGHPVPTSTIFGMDQSPSKVKSSHWMKFLNQDTAVIFGTERYSRRFSQPVIFGRILKLSRGHYKTQFELVTADPDQLPHGAIVEKVMRLLEEDIRKVPHLWLWTHRRWKHKKPAEVISAE
jgi:KDO2-lipid IV(A) lauroyltransferase